MMVMKGDDKLFWGIKQLQRLPEILVIALTQTYSERKMKRFAKIANGWKLKTVKYFHKTLHLRCMKTF